MAESWEGDENWQPIEAKAYPVQSKPTLGQRVRALEWTEEIRPGHPWRGDLLVRKQDVLALLKRED